MGHAAALPTAAPDSLSEARRHAYNCAFEALELNWHWDAATWARLAPHGTDAVRVWLQTRAPHLLRAYEPDFLVTAIESLRDAALNQNVSGAQARA
jgi:hypothetical protein